LSLLDDEGRIRDEADPVSGPGDGAGASVPAWELVEAGRYMPRRIRGSYRGRELG
jgi:hypothetical protein